MTAKWYVSGCLYCYLGLKIPTGNLSSSNNSFVSPSDTTFLQTTNLTYSLLIGLWILAGFWFLSFLICRCHTYLLSMPHVSVVEDITCLVYLHFSVSYLSGRSICTICEGPVNEWKALLQDNITWSAHHTIVTNVYNRLYNLIWLTHIYFVQWTFVYQII